MLVSKSHKWRHEEFGSKSIFVQLSHEEVGLPDPASPEQARNTFAALSREVEALVLIEGVKTGRVHPNQIAEALKPWLPHLSQLVNLHVAKAEAPQNGVSSSSTEPAPSSAPSTAGATAST